MSVADFLSMGGFGYYVWMSMGMALLMMVGEIIVLKSQHKNMLKQVARIIRIGRNK